MAPATSGTTGLTTFLASATRLQLVIFYIGLGSLSAILCAALTYAMIRFVSYRRRLRQSAPNWKRFMCSTHTKKPTEPRRPQGNCPSASPPAWALAYKQHFEVDSSDCFSAPISPHGMPMLRTPIPPHLTEKEVPEMTPALLKFDKIFGTGTPQTARLRSGPRIVVDYDDTTKRRSSHHDTVFPVFPALSAQKQVIDYLSTAPPHWSSPELMEGKLGQTPLACGLSGCNQPMADQTNMPQPPPLGYVGSKSSARTIHEYTKHVGGTSTRKL